jgi:hypothetical protein
VVESQVATTCDSHFSLVIDRCSFILRRDSAQKSDPSHSFADGAGRGVVRVRYKTGDKIRNMTLGEDHRRSERINGLAIDSLGS